MWELKHNFLTKPQSSIHFVLQKLQSDLETQQMKVDNLKDMVVIVDDNNTEEGIHSILVHMYLQVVHNYASAYLYVQIE